MPIDRRTFLGGTLGSLAAARVALAQAADAAPPDVAPESPDRPEYDAQTHTDDLFRDMPRRLGFKARTQEELIAWQAKLRERLHELLGLTAMTREVPFEGRAERAETERLDGYTREKWYLWTEPNVPLPIWVLIPDEPAYGAAAAESLQTPGSTSGGTGAAKGYPLVLTPHGHNHPEIYLGIAHDERGRASIAEGERDIAVQAVKEGYLAVLPTARGFGETRRADDRSRNRVHSCRTGLMHGLLFGRTMIGYRAWDISRILDWVQAEYPIDPARIAITGNSGGGTTSVFAPACDPRIRVAVPSCYFCTFQASIGSIHHCECNYVPGLLREAEMDDVAGLIAPRPFLAIAGETDGIFPVAAVREAHHRLKQVYRTAGVEERCELFIGAGGHRYYSQPAWAFIRRWFDQPPAG